MIARTLAVTLLLAAPSVVAGCSKGPARPAAATSEAPISFASPPAPGTRARCPVMGEEFTVKADSPTSTHGGRTYVFCCPGCKEPFDKDPAKYVAK